MGHPVPKGYWNDSGSDFYIRHIKCASEINKSIQSLVVISYMNDEQPLKVVFNKSTLVIKF